MGLGFLKGMRLVLLLLLLLLFVIFIVIVIVVIIIIIVIIIAIIITIIKVKNEIFMIDWKYLVDYMLISQIFNHPLF